MNANTYKPPVYTHELLSQYDMYLNGSFFSEFICLALLLTWLNLEPSNLACVFCIFVGVVIFCGQSSWSQFEHRTLYVHMP